MLAIIANKVLTLLWLLLKLVFAWLHAVYVNISEASMLVPLLKRDPKLVLAYYTISGPKTLMALTVFAMDS